MKRALLTTIACAAAGIGSFCGCRASSASAVSPICDGGELWSAPSSAANQHPDSAEPVSPGTVRTVHEPMRTIEGAPTGRVWLLEMYQAALVQRDKNALRAAEMERERDAALARVADAEGLCADLEARNAGLATELGELRAKALELARRLAQAELARLEAEKAELENHPGAGGERSAR